MRPVETDIFDIFEDVKKVIEERDTGHAQKYSSTVRHFDEVTFILPGAWQSLSDAMLSVEHAVTPLEGELPLEMLPKPQDLLARLKFALKRIVRKAVYWYVNPIVTQLHRLHASTARSLREMSDLLRSVSDRLEDLEKQNIPGRIRAFEGERLEERIARLEREWRLLEKGGGGMARESTPGLTLHALESCSAAQGQSARLPGGAGFFFDYYWFESIHRGDRDLIKRRQQQYVRYFEGCRSVLDVGCGRGEFLELLSEKGIGAYGIDIEKDAVTYCIDAGLKVIEAEALEHLSSLEDQSLDGIFISQVVEHMVPEDVILLVGLAHSKLKPGHYVVIETPNPQCLLIFASFFYADISHVKPIHPETLRFLLLSAGFRNVEINFTNPVPKSQRLMKIRAEVEGTGDWVEELNQNFEKLNSVLFGFMDYAAVAQK